MTAICPAVANCAGSAIRFSAGRAPPAYRCHARAKAARSGSSRCSTDAGNESDDADDEDADEGADEDEDDAASLRFLPAGVELEVAAAAVAVAVE